MNNTKSARIKDIRKVFRRKWPDYRVVGNYSHDKGVWVLRKDSVPVITQIFNKNYDLFRALFIPGYHPGKSLEEIYKRNTFGATFVSPSISKAHIRNLLNAFISHYKTAQILGEVFDIYLPDMPINTAQKRYKKLK